MIQTSDWAFFVCLSVVKSNLQILDSPDSTAQRRGEAQRAGGRG